MTVWELLRALFQHDWIRLFHWGIRNHLLSVGLFSQTGDLQISSQGSRLTFGAFWELSEEKGRDLIIQYVYCDLNVLFSVHHFCLQCSGYEIPLFRKNKKQKTFFFPCWVRKRKFSGWVCWKRWIWARCMCAQLFPTLCSLIDSSLPGSSVHGIFQARILEWVAIFFSRGSLQPKDWTQVSGIGRQMFYHCDTCKVLESGQGVGLIAIGFWYQDCFQVWTCFIHILLDVGDVTSLLEVNDAFNFETFQSSLI